MDKATDATTTTAPHEHTTVGDDTFLHAAAVAASIVDPLTPDTRPSSVRIEPNFPSGWAVTILFLSHHAAGLYEVAANTGAPITRAFRDEEIHLEAFVCLKNVDVRAAVLVTPTQAAELEGEHTPAKPLPTRAPTARVEEPPAEDQAATQPVPLGVSVLATVPAVTPVQPQTAEQGTEAADGGE